MRLTTWNINGIRAMKSPLKDLLHELSSDIICFQETKVTRERLESDIALVDGFSSYYSCSQTKQGYSGVATFCSEKVTPIRAQEGLYDRYEAAAGSEKIGCYGKLTSMFTEERLTELDKEGRTMITQHKFHSPNGEEKLLTIINVYCPRVDPENPTRKQFKIDFCRALEERAIAILNSGSSVIVCGDINISHRRIDHCDPDDPELFYDNESRQWMDGFLLSKGDYSAIKSHEVKDNNNAGEFVDSFRYFHPNRLEAFTCWCTLKGCRKTNYGTRIDYILANAKFQTSCIVNCDICPEVEGSDHCPVVAEFSCSFQPAKKFPTCCTNLLPKFGGRQKKLSQYFGAKPAKTEPNKVAQTQKSVAVCGKESVVVKRKNIFPAKTGAKQTKLSHFIAKQCPKVPTQLNSSTVTAKPSKVPQQNSWKMILKGPDPPPLCKGHNEPCVMRTVKKEGPNCGKKFYCCARPEGHKTNKEARCTFFQWKT